MATGGGSLRVSRSVEPAQYWVGAGVATLERGEPHRHPASMARWAPASRRKPAPSAAANREFEDLIVIETGVVQEVDVTVDDLVGVVMDLSTYAPTGSVSVSVSLAKAARRVSLSSAPGASSTRRRDPSRTAVRPHDAARGESYPALPHSTNIHAATRAQSHVQARVLGADGGQTRSAAGVIDRARSGRYRMGQTGDVPGYGVLVIERSTGIEDAVARVESRVVGVTFSDTDGERGGYSGTSTTPSAGVCCDGDLLP
jgi:hypothetical protein